MEATLVQQDWRRALTRTDHGMGLFLPRAVVLASRGGDGWYVARRGKLWTIGRRAPDGTAYDVLDAGVPLTFPDQKSASRYLRLLLPSNAHVDVLTE